jgi:predicted HicB family RNase H-like nuclease
MKDTLEYKGFIASVHYSPDDEVFYGKLEGIPDLVTFEGDTVKKLKKAFQEEVDDYASLCDELGKPYFKSYKGSFHVRIPEDLHRKAVIRTSRLKISLNQLVLRSIEKELR